MTRKIIFLIMLLFSLAYTRNYVRAGENAIIYFNEACSDCLGYVNELSPLLAKYNLDANLKDYINNPEFRAELNKDNKLMQVPIEFQDSMTVFLKENVVIEGHVPQKAIEELLGSYDALVKHQLILLYQPEMHSNAEKYTLYVTGHEPQELDASDNLVDAINQKEVKAAGIQEKNLLIPIVAGALANSIHPCAIAVLLLLLTFLYTLRKNKKQILFIGLAYIFGIFIVYFLIGLGLLRAITLSDEPFFVAKAASVILVILGLINVKDYFFPQLPIHLKIPDFTKGSIQSFMEKASVPSAFVVGALVGICAFPCTGGIYTVIISTLAATNSARFILYLLLYNVIFILPLLFILGISANKKLLDKVEKIEQVNARKLHLITGLFMIAIGAAVYLWIAAILYV